MEEEKILVFDSSILLRMYRHSYEDIKKLLKDLEEEKKKIWIPHQTYIEFKENKDSQKLNTMAIGQYNKAINDLENIIKESQEKIITQMEVYKSRKFPKIRIFEDEIINQYRTFNPLIKKYKEIYKKHTEESRKLHKTDPINSLVDKLRANGQVGKMYSISRLLKIYEEAEKRYTYKLPPGYMDDLRYNKNDGKKGVEKYGDYLIWKQMIEKASKENKNLLFVTEDQKEDWLKGGKLRKDLIEEFKELTEGQTIKRLSFKELIEDELDITLNPSLKLELFPENYIKDKKNQIETEVKKIIEEGVILNEYLRETLEFDDLILSKTEIIKIEKINLDLDNIQCLDRNNDKVIYYLVVDVIIEYLINDFYKIKLDGSLFFESNFIILKNNEGDFELTYKNLKFEDIMPIECQKETFKVVCYICQINEGIYDHESGELICESCSSNLKSCSKCGTYFDQNISKQFEICDKCFSAKT